MLSVARTHTLAVVITGIWFTLISGIVSAEEVIGTDLLSTGNLSRSAAFPRDRQFERLFDAVLASTAQQDYAEAAALLQQILNDSVPQSFVQRRGTTHHVSALVQHLLTTLPPEVRAAYQRLVEEDAAQAWQTASRSLDADKLYEVGRRFRNTPTGLRVLRSLINWELDCGNLEAAALYANALAETDNSNRSSRLELELKRISALIHEADEQTSPQREFSTGSEVVTVWKAPQELQPQTHAVIRESLFDLREHGLNPFPTLEAINVDHEVVVGTPLDLRRINPETGEVIWKHLYNGYGIEKFREIADLSDSDRKRGFTKKILHRIYGEAAYRAVTAAPGKLFLIERDKLDVLSEGRGSKRVLPSNKLVCLDSDTGEQIWSFAGGKVAPFFFASAPAVHGDRLYLQGEAKSGAILLLVVHADSGELLQSIPLAQSQFPLDSDERRHSQSSPVFLSRENLVFCPTGAGAAVMVDPVWGEVLWAVRYPRNDTNVGNPGVGQPEVETSGYQWWSGWQRTSAFFADGVVVMTSPESDMLVAFEQKSGHVRWALPRAEALFIAHADPQLGVIEIGDNFVCALDIQTGETRWRSELPVPAGVGVLVGHEYLLPIQAVGLARINLLNGTVQTPASDWRHFQHDTLTSDLVSRNLALTDAGLFEVGADLVRKVKLQADSLLAQPMAVDPRSQLQTLVEAGKHGDTTRIIEEVSQLLSHDETGRDSSLRRELAEQLIEMLMQRDFSIARRLQTRVAELLDNPWERANWRQRQLSQLVKERKWSAFADIWRSEDAEVWEQRLPTLEGERRVRLQNWAIGQLQDVISGLNAAERAECQQVMIAQLEVDDLENMRHHALSTLFETETVGAKVPQVSAMETQQRLAVRTPWPERVPRQTVKTRQFVNIANQVPVQAARGSLLDRINVDLDYPSPHGVIFSSDQLRNWTCSFPNSTSHLRYEKELTQAWGFGDLLVLQVGSEVVGMRPLDEQGNRESARLWPAMGETSIDTLGHRSRLLLSFQEDPGVERPGFYQAVGYLVDEFGHSAAEVGPVNERYFVIQQKGMLVAYETQTGQEIWRRFDLPERALCFGNAEEMTVVSRTTGHQQVIRAVDGKLLRTAQIPFHCDEIVLEQGSCVILADGDPTQFDTSVERSGDAEDAIHTNKLVLRCVDVISQQEIWQREFTQGTMPFEIDLEWMGVLIPMPDTGKAVVEFLNRRDGTTVVSHSLDFRHPVTRVACSVATEDFLLAISTTIDDKQLSSAKQRFQGFRRPMINGRLYRFERNTGGLDWEIDFPNTILPLDQPVDLPIFITAESRYPEEQMDSGTPGSRLRCYDRRTGEMFYENESLSPTLTQYGINARRSKEEIILNTQLIQVEFDYSDPALDEPKKADAHAGQPDGEDEQSLEDENPSTTE